jgi:nucleotide-binding universal stress UspA family protein
MKTIVLGYHDSESARRALERTAELARAFGAKVVVTSVAPVLVGRGVGPGDTLGEPDAHRQELADAAAYLAERGVQSESELALGYPASHIVELAEQRNADLIVVGTHEPGFLERLLEPSVSDAVERRAHCDVLIVHGEE